MSHLDHIITNIYTLRLAYYRDRIWKLIGKHGGMVNSKCTYIVNNVYDMNRSADNKLYRLTWKVREINKKMRKKGYRSKEFVNPIPF